MKVEVGDIFACMLKDGVDGRRYNNLLPYDAMFRDLPGALHYIRTSEFDFPVVHTLVYVGDGCFTFGDIVDIQRKGVNPCGV